jgi:glycosyl transferase family 2
VTDLPTSSVSVIMPAYREEGRIAAALDSLASQSMAPLEVIVVDDGSPDRSGAIARARGARVIRTNHRGAGAARDAGQRSSRGQILVFVDADNVFAPDFLEALVSPIAAGAAASTFPGGITLLNEGEGLAPGWLRVRGVRNLNPPRRAATHPWPIAMRRADLEAAGGYPHVGHGEDEELGRRLGAPALVVPAASYASSVPCTWVEVLRTARWIGRGPRFRRERGPLRHLMPPWLLIRAMRLLVAGEATTALVRVLYDAGVLFGFLEARLLPSRASRA